MKGAIIGAFFYIITSVVFWFAEVFRCRLKYGDDIEMCGLVTGFAIGIFWIAIPICTFFGWIKDRNRK